MVFDQVNNKIYVTNYESLGKVSVISGSTNKVIENVPVGSGSADLVFNTVNGNVYVSNSKADSVSVIDGSTNKVVSTLHVGFSFWHSC